MSVIHAPKRPSVDLRVLIFPVAVSTVLTVIFFRLWYIQVVKAPELTDRAEHTRGTTVSLMAPRGVIQDRTGKTVAGVRTEFVVTAVPAEIKKNPWVMDKLAELLGADRQKLVKKVELAMGRKYLPTTIYVGVPVEKATLIAESQSELPGISVESQPMRYYDDPISYAHVLGYVYTPSDFDVKRLASKGLEPASYVGKQGVEFTYEPQLMGEQGVERWELDSRAKPTGKGNKMSRDVLTRLVGRDNPPGARLTLTVDNDLQHYALKALDGFNGGHYKGGAVAIDPKTGEVLCMVSNPTFDSSLFERGVVSPEDWSALSSDPSKPMLNRATASAYAPGSTFKIVTAIAALEAGALDLNRTEFCDGGYKVGRKMLTKCLGHHGFISFHEAFYKSCNTYFADLGVRAGHEAMEKASIECGLNAKSGIDTTGERRGLIPTKKWLSRYRNPPTWYTGDTVNMSIGQGEVLTTPLQMANLAALVGNNGVQFRPHLIKSIKASGDQDHLVAPEVLHHVDAPSWFWTELKAAMTDVVERGTAQHANIPGLRWGGKTGSAERTGQEKTDSWYIGVAPIDDPKIAICVHLEDVGHGGDFSAPVAADIVRHYLAKLAKVSSKGLPRPSASAASAE